MLSGHPEQKAEPCILAIVGNSNHFAVFIDFAAKYIGIKAVIFKEDNDSYDRQNPIIHFSNEDEARHTFDAITTNGQVYFTTSIDQRFIAQSFLDQLGNMKGNNYSIKEVKKKVAKYYHQMFEESLDDCLGLNPKPQAKPRKPRPVPAFAFSSPVFSVPSPVISVPSPVISALSPIISVNNVMTNTSQPSKQEKEGFFGWLWRIIKSAAMIFWSLLSTCSLRKYREWRDKNQELGKSQVGEPESFDTAAAVINVKLKSMPTEVQRTEQVSDNNQRPTARKLSFSEALDVSQCSQIHSLSLWSQPPQTALHEQPCPQNERQLPRQPGPITNTM